MQDAGCRMQDAGCRMQDAGCRMKEERRCRVCIPLHTLHPPATPCTYMHPAASPLHPLTSPRNPQGLHHLLIPYTPMHPLAPLFLFSFLLVFPFKSSKWRRETGFFLKNVEIQEVSYCFLFLILNQCCHPGKPAANPPWPCNWWPPLSVPYFKWFWVYLECTVLNLIIIICVQPQ